jgi:hypothetical protein
MGDELRQRLEAAVWAEWQTNDCSPLHIAGSIAAIIEREHVLVKKADVTQKNIADVIAGALVHDTWSWVDGQDAAEFFADGLAGEILDMCGLRGQTR